MNHDIFCDKCGDEKCQEDFRYDPDKNYCDDCYNEDKYPDYSCNECGCLASESELDGNGNCEQCAYDIET